jgi:hypothetical protein
MTSQPTSRTRAHTNGRSQTHSHKHTQVVGNWQKLRHVYEHIHSFHLTEEEGTRSESGAAAGERQAEDAERAREADRLQEKVCDLYVHLHVCMCMCVCAGACVCVLMIVNGTILACGELTGDARKGTRSSARHGACFLGAAGVSDVYFFVFCGFVAHGGGVRICCAGRVRGAGA